MGLSPNVARKKVGCWGCVYSQLNNVATDATVSCAHEDPAIRNEFAGWDSALTCPEFKLKTTHVEVVDGGKKDNG